MTGKEIHEQISAYVDERVDELEYRAKLRQHIKQCAGCRSAFELELMSRTVVREQAERAPAPGAPLGVIGSGVDGNGAGPAAHEPVADSAAPVAADRQEGGSERAARFFTAPLGVIAAILLIVVCGYRIMTGSEESADAAVVPADTQPPPKVRVVSKYIGNLAATNFDELLRKKAAVEHATSDCADLGAYFKSKGVSYPVACLPLSARLTGGSVTKHGDLRLAHLVYTSGEAIVYVLEVPQDVLNSGEVFNAPPSVMQDLANGKVIWESPDPRTPLALVRRGGVVLAIVSNAPIDRLKQMLLPALTAAA